MRKIINTIVFGLAFFLPNYIFSQLYVASGSYVYAQDAYVTVTQDINLANNGNIYLRDESQLLQKTAGSGSNTGLGSLSLFQEGTVNNFQYNYWCSPVGASSASVGNSPFSITQFHRPTGLITSNPAVMLSNSALDGIAADLSIAPRWIYRFLSSNQYSQWILTRTNAINPGEGFTMKGTSGTDTAVTVLGVQNNPGSAQRYDFRGKPNDGDISITVANGMRTLTGNPYPSAILLGEPDPMNPQNNSFLTDPANTTVINGNAYFWEHSKFINSHNISEYEGGYGTYNGATNNYNPATFSTYDGYGDVVLPSVGSGTDYERLFTPIGQGFKVEGITDGTVTMKNSYRVFRKEGSANQSEFERNANHQVLSEEDYGYYDDIPNVAGIDFTQLRRRPVPHIRFNTSLNDMAIRQVSLCFLNHATDGVDLADAKSPDADSTKPFDMYFVLDNTEYVQSTTSFDIAKRFPVGFKNTSQATFRIQVADFINFNEVENVYLHDKQTGLYHDIRNNEYQFTIEPGVHNDRFEVTFINEVLSIPTLSDSDFLVHQNNAQQQLMLHNPKSYDIKSVRLYDVTGKLVISEFKIGTQASYKISTSGLSDAVYIAKVETDGGEYAKKVSVVKEY